MNGRGRTVFYADLHIHSHFSRATSRDLDIFHIALWALKKGLTLVATGDIAHPGWLAEVEEALEPAEGDLLRLKPDVERAVHERLPPVLRRPVRFILGGEISNIYKKGERTRKIHHVVFLPTLEAVRRFQARLERIGNIHADGRPILGLDSRDLLEILLETDPRGVLIPAHIWTPWFALLGSKSGFDSVEACFEDLTPHIFALETGLSSDPPMNWRVSALDRYTLVSNSDAHSPRKLGREANRLEAELSYDAIFDAIRSGDPRRFLGTVEFFPEEGKYHYDGHRKCGVRWKPSETIAHGGTCPVCGKRVTVGVLHRVEELADRPEGQPKPNALPYCSLIPLPEVLAEFLGVRSATSKRVEREYERLLAALGPEFAILLDLPLEEIARAGGSHLAEGIGRMRQGQVLVEPGYDGEFGIIRVFAAELMPSGPEEPHQPASEAATLPLFAGPADESTTASPSAPAPQPAPNPPALSSPDGPPVPRLLAEPSPAFELPVDEAGADILEALNPEQRQAVRVLDEHLLIVAGPGTGKTRTLTARMAYLVRTGRAAPEALLAITFTNRAAEEMRGRLAAWLGNEVAKRITVATFHAFAAGLVRTYAPRLGLPPDFVIATDADALEVLRDVAPELSARERQALYEHIQAAKRDPTARHDPALPDAIWQGYHHALRAAGAVDYADLLALAVQLLEEDAEARAEVHARYRWLAVDEYQDVNAVQYRLLRLLAAGGANVCVIGDPDQAIYGFRGADSRYFHAFPEDFRPARVVRLRRNYRSAQAILRAAQDVLRGTASAAAHELLATFAEEVKVEVFTAATERAEAEHVVHQIERLVGGTSYFSLDSGRVESTDEGRFAFGDIAVLYRTRAQARPLVEALDRAGIPYQTQGETPLTQRPAVRAAVALAWLVLNPRPRFHWETALRATGLEALRPSLREALVTAPPEARASELLGQAVEGRSLNPQVARRATELRARLQTAEALHREGRWPEAWNELLDRLAVADDPAVTWVQRQAEEAARAGQSWRAFLVTLALATETDFYDPRADRVALLTLHAAKGLEFPVVFIVGAEDGLLPYRREGASTDEDEERRLFYVGLTRAGRRLFVSHARRRQLYGETVSLPLSPFVQDIQEALKVVHEGHARRRRRRGGGAEQLRLF